MGDITKEKLDLLREVDAVHLDEIWQAFAGSACRQPRIARLEATSGQPLCAGGG